MDIVSNFRKILRIIQAEAELCEHWKEVGMRIAVVVMTLAMSVAVAAAFQFASSTSAQLPIKPNPVGPVEELGRFLFWDQILI